MALRVKYIYQLWLSVSIALKGATFVLLMCSNIAVSANTTLDIDQHFHQLANADSPPKVYDKKVRANGITELFIEGEEYQGKPSRIFALYRLPANPLILPSGKVPAVVLVHGGGGTAFEAWVDKWNNAGFAAISVAVEGQLDARPSDYIKGTKAEKRWQRHAFSGPARSGIYADNEKELTQQWMFHAVAATIRAKRFLQSQQAIDAEQIGISGISWGGVITSTVIGFDPSFRFAIPIYGCGFLDQMENQYKLALTTNDIYRQVWEPGLRIGRFSHPSMWLTWRDDKHFDLASHANTYSMLSGPVSISIKPNIRHGHAPGWEQDEAYVFAQQTVKNQLLVINQSAGIVAKGLAEASFSLAPNAYSRVTGATIHYTSSDTHTGQADWLESSVPVTHELSASEHRFKASFKDLPQDLKHWFINLHIVTYNDKTPADVHFIASSRLVSSK